MDYYMPIQQFNSLSDETQISLLLRAVVLDEEQQELYGYLTQELEPERQSQREDLFWQDVANCKAQGLQNVWTDSSGFGGNIALEEDKFVVFTVPYDTGFKAYVNGVETPVLKVDNGMMAIVCPAGYNEITFTYHTPLFAMSCRIALGAGVIFVIYLVVCRRLDKRKKSPVLSSQNTESQPIKMIVDEENQP